jgi:L-rhamnose mutarotase
MVLGGIVSSYGGAYSQTVTKNKQTDSTYESKSENLPTTDNTPDNAEAKTNASVQDIYNGLTTYYKGVPLEQWASSDPKYTDAETGISWYVRDGKHPYMTGEDAEKFKRLCEETGEPWLKKFGEMTGVIQQLDDNTVAYVGDNGTAIKSNDGKELFVDTSSLTYDQIMSLFRNLSKTNNYFDSGYWQENIRKVQQNSSNAASDSEVAEEADGETEKNNITDYSQFIQEYIEKLFVKIENDDTEPTFQIGNQSFTIKEWDEFLEKFDSAEDAIKELVEEEIEKRKQAEQVSERTVETAQKTEMISDVQMDMLSTETVQARFPLQAVDEDGKQKEDLYLVAIDKNGIRCSKPGSDEYEWEIVFTDESQYEKATDFMDWANDHMDNFLFSAHQNFWEDYLNGDMDVEAFQEFLAGTNNGIPDYSITAGDSMYIDKSKVQWAKYVNHPVAKIYTAREMAEMVAQEFERNQAELTSLSASYSETYKKLHPEYHGEAIFCEYPGGRLYTVDEIGKLMYERAVQSRAS